MKEFLFSIMRPISDALYIDINTFTISLVSIFSVFISILVYTFTGSIIFSSITMLLLIGFSYYIGLVPWYFLLLFFVLIIFYFFSNRLVESNDCVNKESNVAKEDTSVIIEEKNDRKGALKK